MSKSGSSIQYGWSSPSGTITKRRRRGGTSGSRDSISRVNRSKVNGSGEVDGSRTHTLPTCPKTAGVSIARKAASRPVSCSMSFPFPSFPSRRALAAATAASS